MQRQPCHSSEVLTLSHCNFMRKDDLFAVQGALDGSIWLVLTSTATGVDMAGLCK
jgi:hypothetical protein